MIGIKEEPMPFKYALIIGKRILDSFFSEQYAKRNCILFWNRGIQAKIKDVKTGKVIYKKG